MFVTHRFQMSEKTQDLLRSLIPPFGYNGFGEFIFYRTYSRIKEDGSNENWADVVIRSTVGTFSIRKDWYIKNHIHWDEEFWQSYAKQFALSLFMMEWTPPGRGLWAMGSEFVYERGSMALNNCAYTDITTDIGDDIAWLMDCLMQGCGVGFGPLRTELKLYKPKGRIDYVIPDTREGWVTSERMLIDCHLKPDLPLPRFIYDKVRGPGLPIKGFGGVSSGPEPLQKLHEATLWEFENYGQRPEYDVVYLKANLANRTGCCVVAGNVRRSAELMKGKFKDPVFMDLKNYEKFPEREPFGGMSNNSVELETDEDFDCLGEIAIRVITNGEPGYINRRNMPFARIGKKMKGLRKDKAVGFNPCGEIPLEHRELCNLAQTYPTVCKDAASWFRACEHATMYASTVSLLPTQQPSTNRVVARNRRIGVSIVDYIGWKDRESVHKVTKYMRDGYKIVRRKNKALAAEAGVPESIRVTTVQPGGTTPKLPGKKSGIGHATFNETLRRVNVPANSPVAEKLIEANVPYEPNYYNAKSSVFEWPILQDGVPAMDVTIWEQAFDLVTVQREWSDNAVSNTLYFRPMWSLIENIDSSIPNSFRDRLEYHFGITATNYILETKTLEYLVPEHNKVKCKYIDNVLVEVNIYEYDPNHEEAHIEPVLSAIAPLTKSVSVLPHSPKGAYRQMPEEGITQAEYLRRLSEITPIDWSDLSGSDGIDEKYCTKDSCG